MPLDDAFQTLPSPYPIDPKYLELARQVSANAYPRPDLRFPQDAPPPPPPPQGTLTDIIHGFKRGVFTQTPEMAGQMLQAFGADRAGQRLREYSATQAPDPSQYVEPGGWGEAASNVVPALSTAALAFIPGVGQVAAPVGAAALFGGSQYTQTKEKLQGEGVPIEDARSAALGTAAVQGIGQGLLAHVGGKLLTGALGRVGTGGAQSGLDSWMTPAFGKQLAKGLGIQTAVQLPTQAAAMASVTGIETAYGAKNEPTAWEAARESIGPTLMMNVLMAPFAGAGTLMSNRKRQQLAQTVASPPDVAALSPGELLQAQKTRSKGLAAIYQDIRTHGEEEAMAWRMEAMQAINDHQPVSFDVNWKYPGLPRPTGGFPVPVPPTGPTLEGEWQPGTANRGEGWVFGDNGAPSTEWAPPVPYEAPRGPLGRDRQLGVMDPRMGAPDAVEPLPRLPAPRGPVDWYGGEGAPAAALAERLRLGGPPWAGEPRGENWVRDRNVGPSTDYVAPPTKEEKIRALRKDLPRAPGEVLGRMVDKQGEDLAAEIRAVWEEKNVGPDNKKPKYLEHLDTFYEKLTGKKLSDVVEAERKAKEEADNANAAAVKTGTEPVAAARTDAEAAVTGGQVHEDARNGAPESAPVAAGARETAAPADAASVAASLAAPEGTNELSGATARVQQQNKIEAGLRLESQWQRLMGGDKKVVVEITPEDAQAHLERLNAAPGDNPQARAELERIAKGKEDATTAGEQSDGNIGERQGAVENRAPTEAGGRDSVEQRAPDGTIQGQGRGDAVAKAERQVAEAKAALDAKQSDLLVARRELSKLNADIFENPGRRPTKEQVQALNDVHARIDALTMERDTLAEFAAHSDAVGRAERAHAKTEPYLKGGEEPMETPAYWRKPVSAVRGIDAQGDIIHAWLSSLVHLGKATERQQAILKQMEKAGMGKRARPTTQAMEEIQAAHADTVASGQDKRLDYMAERWFEAHEISDRLGLFSSAREKADRMREQRMAERDEAAAEEAAQRAAVEKERLRDEVFKLRLTKLAQQRERGEISDRELAKRTEAAMKPVTGEPHKGLTKDDELKLHDMVDKLYAPQMDEAAVQQAKAAREALIKHRRGIEGISDPAIAERVRANPSAMAAMADIARRHRNPVVRAIARLLADSRLTANIVEVENADFKGGRYVPATDTIEIGQGGMNNLTLMHESVHALTHKMLTEAMANVSKPFESLSKQEKAGVSALRTVRGLMDSFGKVADFDDPAHRLAMESEHEFLAEAINNPHVQEALDNRGWLSKLYSKITAWFGFEPTHAPDVEKLMKAASTLFGDPDHASKEVYNRGPAGHMSEWFNSLASISPKLAFKDKMYEGDWPHKILATALTWATNNHVTHMLDRRAQQAMRAMPGAAAAKIQSLVDNYRKIREIIGGKTAWGGYLTQEGNRLTTRMARFAKLAPNTADKLFRMGSEATRLGFDPAMKTFEDAKKRDPNFTREQWDSADGQKLRAMYSDLERESRAMLARDRTADTPVKLYRDMLDKHSLDYTRDLAAGVKHLLDEYKLADHPALAQVRKGTLPNGLPYDRLDARSEVYRNKPFNEAQLLLDKAIYEVMDAHDAFLAQSLGTTKGNITKAWDAAARKAAPHLIDHMEVKDALNSLWGTYKYHMSVPYFHLGRSGEYVVKFTVGGGQAEWDQIGRIVDQQLNRGWGSPYRDNRKVYMRFDDPMKFKQAVDALLPFESTLFREAETGKPTWAAGKADEAFRKLEQTSPKFVRIMENKINNNDAYDAETKRNMVRELQDAYLLSLPETSPLKAKMFRDGDVGYSKDFINTYADRLTSAKGGLVNSYAGPELTQAMLDLMKAKQGLDRDPTPGMAKFAADVAVYTNELRGRVNDSMTPVHTPVLDRIRVIPAAWRLMLSPAYMMMIGYQATQITLPMVGKRYGYADSFRSMISNYSKAAGVLNQLLKMGWADPGVRGLSTFDKLASLASLQFEFSKLQDGRGQPLLNRNDLNALEGVNWAGLFNFGQTNQFARFAPEDQAMGRKLVNLSTIAPHYIEIINRMVAALTAHEMHMKKTTGATLDSARQYALQIVRDTDGDHSQANIARKLGRRGVLGGFTPLVVGFGQFDIQQSELTIREAMKIISKHSTPAERKEAIAGLVGMGATTAAIAGTLGLPFVSLATAIANQVLSWTQDDNETPPDVQHAFRQTMADIFGAKGGEIASRGLPRAIDIDMSSRSGFQDLLPFSEFIASRRRIDDKIKDGSLALMGPAVGVGAGLWTGLRALYDHNYPKFINDALPAEVRNLAKAYRLNKYGYESTSPGNNQIPLPEGPATAWNVFTQALGLESGARAEQQERTFQYKTNVELMQTQQGRIRNQIYLAHDHQQYADLDELMQQSADFSMRHPQLAINPAGGMRERAAQRATAQVSGTGVLTSPRMYPILQNYNFGQ